MRLQSNLNVTEEEMAKVSLFLAFIRKSNNKWMKFLMLTAGTILILSQTWLTMLVIFALFKTYGFYYGGFLSWIAVMFGLGTCSLIVQKMKGVFF